MEEAVQPELPLPFSGADGERVRIGVLAMRLHDAGDRADHAIRCFVEGREQVRVVFGGAGAADTIRSSARAHCRRRLLPPISRVRSSASPLAARMRAHPLLEFETPVAGPVGSGAGGFRGWG